MKPRTWTIIAALAIVLAATSLGYALHHHRNAPEPEYRQGYAYASAYEGETIPSSVWGQSWSKYAAKVGTNGYHFNLNQPAKNVDSGGNQNTWYGVFRPDAPIQSTDRIYVCGPTSSVNFQVRDNSTFSLIFTGTLTNLPVCL